VKKVFFWSLLICVACHALGQGELDGPKQYPQFRTLSGLPGGMFGLDFDGNPTFSGAMAISTPVGASLRGNRYAIGIGSTSTSHNFAFFDSSSSNENTSNGTAFGMFGATIPSVGYVTWCDEILSSKLDHSINFQFSPKLNTQNFGVAFGVQNAFDHWAASGTNFPGDQSTSRSYYGVATYRFMPGSYVSVGHGDQRFSGVFGNASVQLCSRAKLLTEYDGFNWNSGVAINVVKLPWTTIDQDVQITMFLGAIREKYPTWALTVTF
jgi:hypothetical protein